MVMKYLRRTHLNDKLLLQYFGDFRVTVSLEIPLVFANEGLLLKEKYKYLPVARIKTISR